MSTNVTMAPSEHKYVNSDKIADILESIHKTSKIELLDASIKSLASLGKNYSGDIIFCDVKAKVDGEVKEYHWAVKMPPMEMKERLETHRQFKLEEKEMAFYKSEIPKWKKLIDDSGAKIELTMQEAFYTELNEDVMKGSYLVMQNMRHQGFHDDADKSNGLDIYHVKVALEELAKFHALGYAQLKSHPGGDEECVKQNETVYTDFMYTDEANKKVIDAFSDSMKSAMKGYLEISQEPGQDFVTPFMNQLEKESISDLNRCLREPIKDRFNTLVHADAHLNNLVFKYEGDRPVAACWLDVSACYYGNPAGDLAYFLYSSTTPQLRRTHLNHLLGHYHDALVKFLNELKQDPAAYPYTQLLEDFDRYAFFGLIISMYVVPPFYINKEDSIDQSDMDVDWTDEEQVKKAVERAAKKLRDACAKVPQVKTMIAGNFLDVVDRGHLTMNI